MTSVGGSHSLYVRQHNRKAEVRRQGPGYPVSVDLGGRYGRQYDARFPNVKGRQKPSGHIVNFVNVVSSNGIALLDEISSPGAEAGLI